MSRDWGSWNRGWGNARVLFALASTACLSTSPRSRTSSCSFEDCRASITLARRTIVAADIAVHDALPRRLGTRRHRQLFLARRFAVLAQVRQPRAPRPLTPTSSRSCAASGSETRTTLVNRSHLGPACVGVRRTNRVSHRATRAAYRRGAGRIRFVPRQRKSPVASQCIRTAAAFEIVSTCPSFCIRLFILRN